MRKKRFQRKAFSFSFAVVSNINLRAGISCDSCGGIGAVVRHHEYPYFAPFIGLVLDAFNELRNNVLFVSGADKHRKTVAFFFPVLRFFQKKHRRDIEKLIGIKDKKSRPDNKVYDIENIHFTFLKKFFRYKNHRKNIFKKQPPEILKLH